MAEKKKTMMDEVFEDISQMTESFKSNAEEILRTTISEEIDGVVNSMTEAEDEEEVEADVEADVADEVEDEIEMDDETEEESEIEGEDDVVDTLDVADAIDSAIEGGEADADYEEGMDTDVSDIVDVDLTQATDDEVIKVFKKLTADDEIEVVSDKEVKITEPSTGTEYKVEMGDDAAVEAPVMDVDTEIDAAMDIPEMDMYTEEEDCEEMYEIELDESIVAEEEIEEVVESEEIAEEVTTEEEEIEGDEIEEVSRTIGLGDETKGGLPKLRGGKHPAMKESAISEEKYNEVLAENEKLKAEVTEFKSVLKEFRGMLKEAQVFNTNLAYVTKLFTENSTSKSEKQSIVKRFDSVQTLDESKQLFKTIKGELSEKTITESVDKKLTEDVASSKSYQVKESTAYINEQHQRILDLMKK
jgi:hypothetical protein